MRRAGFTLIELMVVIGVIVILAGILIPAGGMIRRYSQWVKSGNQMQQIGIGLQSYQYDYDGREVYPPLLSDMFLPGGVMAAESPQILVDPADFSPGASNHTNRAIEWTNLEYIVQAEPRQCSYLYEVNGLDFTPHMDWWSGDLEPYTGTGPPTWADYKREQLLRGNMGQPFNRDHFPILRSYWHHNWNKGECHLTVRKVINVSWNGNVFESTPYWEFEQNSALLPGGGDCR